MSNNDINRNQSSPPKIYLGNFQEKERQSGDPFLAGFINITKLLEELGYEVVKKNQASINPECIHTLEKNGHEFLKVIVSKFKNGVNKYGNTHCISVDTFRPRRFVEIDEEETDGNKKE